PSRGRARRQRSRSAPNRPPTTRNPKQPAAPPTAARPSGRAAARFLEERLMRILASATVVLRRIVDLGLVALIAVVLGGLILGKGAPLVGARSIIIGGGSMEPTIH